MISALPSDLVHVLARFAPGSTVALVRASQSLWTRFADDAHFWSSVVAAVQTSRAGRALVRAHAAGVLARRPYVDHVVTLPVATMAPHFALSQDGSTLACGHVRAIRIVHLDAALRARGYGRTMRMNEPIEQLAFSPSEALLASRSSRAVELCDCESWTRWRVVSLPQWSLLSLCFLPNDSIVAGSNTGGVAVFHPHTRSPPRDSWRVDSAAVHALASSRSLVAAGLGNGAVVLLDHEGRRQRTLTAHTCVVDVCFAPAAAEPDGALLVSAGRDGMARVWDTRSGACLRAHDFGGGWVVSVALRDGMLAALLDEARELRVVPVMGGAELKRVAAHAPVGVALAPRGADGKGRALFAQREVGAVNLVEFVFTAAS